MTDAVYDVGDTALLSLAVAPVDVDTDATVAVTAPDGTTSNPTPTSNLDKSLWQLVLPLTAAGEWRAVWTVTGSGAGVQTDRFYAIGDPVGRVYATPADYAQQTGEAPPEGARRLLLRASRLLDVLLRSSIYNVDEDGMPTDTAIAAAIREATVAQVEWFEQTGDVDGSAALFQSVSIGSASMTRGYTSSGSATGGEQRYAPDAVNALRGAGLLGGRPLIPGVGGRNDRFFYTQGGL